MKKNGGRGLYTFYRLPLMVLLTLIAAVSCDNFMLNTDEEDTFKEEIEEAVWVATAPQLTVTVQQNGNEGTTTPLGSVTVKQQVPFRVNFTADKDYAFVEWRAYTADEAKTPLDAGIVAFVNKNSEETDVTVMVADGKFLIQPYCIRRVAVQMTAPTGDDTTRTRVRNTPIEVRFTKAIDPNSFIWQEGEARTSTFKNVRIRGAGNLGNSTEEDYEKYFKEPKLEGPDGDKRRLVIETLPGESGPPPLSRIYVFLEKNITDTDGYTMADTAMFNYTVSDKLDSEGPVMQPVEVARGGHDDLLPPAAVNEHRVKDNEILIVFSAIDHVTNDAIDVVTITEKHLFNADGTPRNQEYDVFPTLFASHKLAESLSQLGSAYEGIHTPADNITVIPYTLQSGDGVVELTVTATDTNNNPSEQKYILIKDTTPPDVANISNDIIQYNIGASSGWLIGASDGWLSATQSKLAFTSSPGHTIQDSGVDSISIDGTDYRTRSDSALVQWAFRLENGDWCKWGYANKSLSVSVEDIDTSSDYAWLQTKDLGQDGEIPIYVKLRDDMENETGEVRLTSIKKDTHPATIESITVRSANVIGVRPPVGTITAGGVPFTNDFSAFFTKRPITVTLNNVAETGSGIRKIHITGSKKLTGTDVKVEVGGITYTANLTGIDTTDLTLELSDGSGNPITPQVNGQSLVITGLSISSVGQDDASIEGVLTVSARLDDAVGNSGTVKSTSIGVAMKTPVHTYATDENTGKASPNFRLVPIGKDTAADEWLVTTDVDLIYEGIDTGASGLAAVSFSHPKTDSTGNTLSIGYDVAQVEVTDSTNSTIIYPNTSLGWFIHDDGQYIYYQIYFSERLQNSHVGVNAIKVRIKGLKLKQENSSDTASASFVIKGAVYNITCDVGTDTQNTTGRSDEGTTYGYLDPENPVISSISLTGTAVKSAGSVPGITTKAGNADSMNLEITFKETGTGLKTIEFKDNTFTPTGGVAKIDGIEYPYTWDTNTITFTSTSISSPKSSGSGSSTIVIPGTISATDGEKTVTVNTVTDRAGNTAGGSPWTDEIFMDRVGPVFSDVRIRNNVLGYELGGYTGIEGKVIYTVKVTETGTGIKKIIFGDDNKFTNVTAVKFKDVPITSGWSYDDNTLSFTTRLVSEDGGSNLEIIGTVAASDGSKSISIDTGADQVDNAAISLVGNAETSLPLVQPYSVDTAPPTISEMEFTKPYASSDRNAVLKITYQDLDGAGGAGAGLKTLQFANNNFEPKTAGSDTGTAYISSETGTSVTYSYSNNTLVFDDSEYLRGNSNITLFITGIVGNKSGQIIATLKSVSDQVGNQADLNKEAEIFRDPTPVAITGVEFVEASPNSFYSSSGTYTKADGAKVKITFIEKDSGLTEFTLSGGFTPSTSGTVLVNGNSSLSIDFTYSDSLVAFTSPIMTDSNGAASYIEIPGTLNTPDDSKTVTVTTAKDVAGNVSDSTNTETTGVPRDSNSIYRDTKPPEFGAPTLENDGTGGAKPANYTTKDVIYTVSVTESGSGIKQITFGTNADTRFATVTGVTLKDTPLDNNTDWTYDNDTTSLTNGVLSFKTRQASPVSIGESDKPVDLVITGTITDKPGSRSIALIASSSFDNIGHAAGTGILEASITLDNQGPQITGMTLDVDAADGKPGTEHGGPFSKKGSKAKLTISFNEFNGATNDGAGLYSITFAKSGNDFTPATHGNVTAYKDTTTINIPYSVSGNTLKLEPTTDEQLAAIRGSGSITISGTLSGSDGEKHAKLASAVDRVGNENTSLTDNGGVSTTPTPIILDTKEPEVTSLTLVQDANVVTVGGTRYTQGTVTVRLEFTEAHSGLHTIKFGANFTPLTPNTSETPATGTAQVNSSGTVTYTFDGDMLTFKNPESLKDTNAQYIEITGELSGEDGEKTVSVTEVVDYAGNDNTTSKETTTNVYLDTASPVFGTPSLVNGGTGPATDYTQGSVIYTVEVTESGSGIKQITFGTDARFDDITDVTLDATSLIKNTDWEYTTGVLSFKTRQASSAGNPDQPVDLVITGTITGTSGVRYIKLVKDDSTDNVNRTAGTGDLSGASITLDKEGPTVSGTLTATSVSSDNPPLTTITGFTITDNAGDAGIHTTAKVSYSDDNGTTFNSDSDISIEPDAGGPYVQVQVQVPNIGTPRWYKIEVQDKAGNLSLLCYVKAEKAAVDSDITVGIGTDMTFRIGTITRGIADTVTRLGSGIRNVFTGGGNPPASTARNARTNNAARNTASAGGKIDAARMTEKARFADTAGVNIEDLTDKGYQSTAYEQQLAALRKANGYTKQAVPASMARNSAQKSAAAQSAEQTAVKAETPSGKADAAGKKPAENADTGANVQAGPERAEDVTEQADAAEEALNGEGPETADSGTALISAAAFGRLPVTLPEPAGNGEEPRKNGGTPEQALVPAKIKQVRKTPRRKPRSSI